MGKTLTFNPANIIFGSAGALGATGAGPGVVLTAAQLRDAADLASTDSATFAGLTLTGNLLFTDNTYNIGALGATRPACVFVGTKIVTPWLDNPSATLTLGNSGQIVSVTGRLQTKTGSSSAPAITGSDSNSGIYWRGSDDIICFGTNGIPLMTMSDAYAPMYNINLASGLLFGWSSSANPESTFQDTAFARVSAGIAELNNGTRVSAGGTVGTLCVGTVKNTASALLLGHTSVGVTISGDLRLATSYGLSLDGATFSSFLVKSSIASTGTRLVASSGTGLSFEIGAGTTVGRFAQTTGNFLVGTTTDDGTSKLQVAGKIAVSGNLLFNTTNSYDVGDGTYDPRTVRAATSVLTPLVNNPNAAATTLGNSTYGVTVPGQATFSGFVKVTDGTYSAGFIPWTYDGEHALLVRNGTNTGNGNIEVAKSLVRSTLRVQGASTFESDVSMMKASAQGYIRAYSQNGTHNTNLFTINSGTGYLATSGGSLYLQPFSGDVLILSSGSNTTFRTYDASGAKYTMMTHDGTNGIVSTSSGDVQLAPVSSYTNLRTSGLDAVLRIYSGSGTLCQLTQGGTVATFSTGGTLRITSAVTGFELKPAAGYIEQWTSGSNGSYYVFDSSGSKATRLANDGTNGLVATTAGALVLMPATSIIGIGGITSSYPAIKRSSTTAAFRLGDDSADAPISCAGITASGAVLQTAEVTNTPSGTTQTITLTSGNYQTLTLASSTGDVTVTLTVPATSGGGDILIVQHGTTPRDITWAASAGSIIWLGSEPSWNGDAVSSVRNVRWRFNGTNTYLTSSGSS